MNTNLHIDPGMVDMDMVNYGMNPMGMSSPSDQHQGFIQQLHDAQAYGIDPMAGFETGSDPGGKNRNRGNYRCSKCGEPKKGHVCPLVPANFKCTRCGLTKKACTCEAPKTRDVGTQVEMDEDMTTRVIDLSTQGMFEMPAASQGYPSPPSSAYASPVSYASPASSMQ